MVTRRGIKADLITVRELQRPEEEIGIQKEDVEAVIVPNTSFDRVLIDFAKLADLRDMIHGTQLVQRIYD